MIRPLSKGSVLSTSFRVPSSSNIDATLRKTAEPIFESVLGLKVTDDDVKGMMLMPNFVSFKERANEYIRQVKIPAMCTNIYQELLGRPVDEPAMTNYVNSFLEGKLTLDQLRHGVEGSVERKAIIDRKNKSEHIIKSIKDLGYRMSDFKDQIVSSSCSGLRVSYLGPIGRTGYAQAAKAYLYSLFVCGADVSFKAIQEHGYINMEKKTLSVKDKVLYASMSNEFFQLPNVVIIHSVPDQWDKRIMEERMKYPRALVVGITVWETDKIHPDWIPMMNKVDLLITPCEWNRATFSRSVTPCVFTVHNPIDMLPEADGNEINKLNVLLGGRRMFYTINEWTGRKGIEDLISCFLQTFTEKDNVALYLKCSAGNHDACRMYIASEKSRYTDPPMILFDGRDVSDATISAIHSRGDVYCSFTRAEGTGLGAAEAIWWGNPVVIGGYGGQMDYMKGCFFISCYEERPMMCTSQQNGHTQCSDSICRIYPWYLPDQTWGHPVIDDAKRIFKFVEANYDICKTSSVVPKMYLLSQCSSLQTGITFGSILKRSIVI